MKKQLATTLPEGTIKKIKMLALEYGINANDVIEIVFSTFSDDDVEGKFNDCLQIYNTLKKY